MLRVFSRAALVLAGALAVYVGGAALLQQNAAAQPLWTGPQAVALAQSALERTKASEAAAQQQVADLQAQAQELAAQADALGRIIAAAEQASLQGGAFAPQAGGRIRSQNRGFGGDRG